jgi:F0F1-type ATP synthase assembly protein I
MGGWLFEAYARYDWVWIVSVLLALFAGFLTVLIKENREPKQAPSGDAVAA